MSKEHEFCENLLTNTLNLLQGLDKFLVLTHFFTDRGKILCMDRAHVYCCCTRVHLAVIGTEKAVHFLPEIIIIDICHGTVRNFELIEGLNITCLLIHGLC